LANTNSIGPQYYRRGSIQVWDFIRDQGLNFHLGNAIKYICRAGHKDSKVQDLNKAIHYLQNELDYTIENPDAAGEGISYGLSDQELYEESFTDYAEAFDR
jgi:hypothetical protein